jgi:hypothetical protein
VLAAGIVVLASGGSARRAPQPVPA